MQFNGFWDGLRLVLSPLTFVAMLGGSFIGIIIGAIPGLGASIGMSLLLPLVYFWPKETGLVLLTALWMADQYGGSISSILLGIPGTAGAVFTCLDGHPMAKQGKSATALGLAMAASAVGGIISAICFMVSAPLLASLVLKFGSPEYFLLSMLGLTVIATTSQKSVGKGLTACGVGLLVSFVGIDLLTGYPRFSFGTTYLMSKIEFQVVILGCFAVGKLISLGASKDTKIIKAEKLSGNIFEGLKLAFHYPVTLIRSALVGTIIGALPGTGVSAATALAYQQTVSSSKHPERFGKGEPEGVVAPEAANNAVQGGGLIPTLTMGIPGSVSAAVFLGGLVMYGIRPGPEIFVNQGPLVWAIFWAMVGAIVCFLVFGILFSKPLALVTQVSIKYLIPLVFVLIIGGAYGANNNPLDLIAMLFFGVLSYFMDRQGYPAVPLLLGFILGPTAEQNFFRSLLISHGSYKIFLQGIINPILIILTVMSLAIPLWNNWKTERCHSKADLQES
jgi:putative tricarboxylic transport membrane protein